MDIILIIIIVYLFTTIKKRKKKENNDDLTVNVLLPVRGICATAIILHHISEKTIATDYYLFNSLIYIGYLPVSIFFAISGYALSVQYHKNKKYLNGFLKKRYTKLLFPFFIASIGAIIMYAVYDIINGNNLLIEFTNRLIKTFTKGTLILPFSWFVIVQTLLYLLFYIVYRFSINNQTVRLCFIFGGSVIIMVSTVLMGYHGCWYNSLFAFIIGIIYYHYSKSKYDHASARWLKLLYLTVLFICVTILKLYSESLLFTILGSCLFPILIFEIIRSFKVNSNIFNYLGNRSYEIYLCQGIPMFIFLKLITIKNDVLYFVIVLASTIIMAEILHLICQKIYLKRNVGTKKPVS